jgi:hypothetical protein
MGDEALIRILAKLPPVKWPETILRFPVVAAYCRLQTPTVAEADKAAELLGVKRRMFYHLLHNYRSLARPDLPAPVRADSRALNPVALRIVEETIAGIGFTASEAEITRSIQQKCEAAGVQSHSEGVVRTRLGRLRRKDLRRRLGISADMILDCCALEIDTRDHQGAVTAAALTAVIEVKSGRLMSHGVTAGRPSIRASDACVHQALEHAVPRPRSIRQTTNAARLDGTLLADWGLHTDVAPTRYVKGGMPLTVALGPRLGRISLRPSNRAFLPSRVSEPLMFYHVTEVVADLVQTYNESLATTN